MVGGILGGIALCVLGLAVGLVLNRTTSPRVVQIVLKVTLVLLLLATLLTTVKLIPRGDAQMRFMLGAVLVASVVAPIAVFTKLCGEEDNKVMYLLLPCYAAILAALQAVKAALR